MSGALPESPGGPGPETRAAPCSVRNLNRGLHRPAHRSPVLAAANRATIA